MAIEQARIVLNNLVGNHRLGDDNRQQFRAAGVLAVNVMASAWLK